MYYVYILTCGDGSLYTGTTNDVEKRVKTHNSGKGAKYTRSHLPVTLSYVEELPDKSTALKREAEIKRMSRGEKMRLVRGFGQLEG
jgi:putative endonuclease